MVDGEVVRFARDCAEHVFGSAGYLPGVERHSTGNLEALESPAVQLLLVCCHSLVMFHAFGNYFQERRRGLTKVAGFVGGAYMVGRYVSQRLDDVRNSILLERAAREK